MSSRDNQAEALEQRAAMRLRDDLVVYRLSGDDQRTWLNGQVTNDVRHTQAGQGVYGLAITVKGRVMADVWALDLGDAGLAVVLPASAAQTVIERFDSQIIMEDVELAAAPELQVMSVQGPRSGVVVDAVREEPSVFVCEADELGLGGYFVLAPEAKAARVAAALEAALVELGGVSISEPAWELVRVRRGQPRFGNDFGPETYPQEAGLKERAVSFNKGCYVGQEVVCTLENRGRLSRRLCKLRADAALNPGSQVLAEDGSEIGKITSSVDADDGSGSFALGMLKRAHAEAGARVLVAGQGVTVLGPVDPS